MRDIKFRAWHKINKDWTYLFVHPQGQVQFQYPVSGGLNENLEDWQQFTGLKDKNGKEIYEEDIVKFYDAELIGNKWRIEQVLWRNYS